MHVVWLCLSWYSWHLPVWLTDVRNIWRIPWHFLIRDRFNKGAALNPTLSQLYKTEIYPLFDLQEQWSAVWTAPNSETVCPMIHILHSTDTVSDKEITCKIIQYCIKPHMLYRHTHREDTADEVLVNTLHHRVGGYTGTNPSHPSSFASLYPAPPSNPPHNLSVQLELASHSHLLSPLLLSLLLTAMDFCLIYQSFSLPFSLSSPLFSCHPLRLPSSHPLLFAVCL